MVIDNFFVKKLEKLNELFILFSTATRSPFIVCNPETFDDEVYVFTQEEPAKEEAKTLDEGKHPVMVLKIPKAQIMGFFNNLYAYGVNSIVLNENESSDATDNKSEKISIPLEQIVKKPDIEKLLNDKVPRINPEVQITSIYFLQEVRRKIQRSPEENKRLKEMEEEMAVNLFRSRFIIALDMNGTDAKFDPKDKNQKYKLVTIKTKNEETFLPCFSDFNEFHKFSMANKKGKFHLLAIPYKNLRNFCKEAKGIIVNPVGFNLLLRNETIDKMNNMYGAPEPDAK